MVFLKWPAFPKNQQVSKPEVFQIMNVQKSFWKGETFLTLKTLIALIIFRTDSLTVRRNTPNPHTNTESNTQTWLIRRSHDNFYSGNWVRCTKIVWKVNQTKWPRSGTWTILYVRLKLFGVSYYNWVQVQTWSDLLVMGQVWSKGQITWISFRLNHI